MIPASETDSIRGTWNYTQNQIYRNLYNKRRSTEYKKELQIALKRHKKKTRREENKTLGGGGRGEDEDPWRPLADQEDPVARKR